MAPWYSSWLPSFPSIDFVPPSSIQRRFVSFALKKSLGHLLKPGQLDINQIESQIGSGYVQVRDLELDNVAINSLLSGLPVELYDGCISSATVRIPWPNPLTSTIGVSMQSLHLIFHLLPSSKQVPLHSVNLGESVISIAESFIHDELTVREEADLRESFHSDMASSQRFTSDDSHSVPGSIDPFLSVPEDEDVDPPGISVFATLIERLLARFEFDAVDTKITLVHPGHTSFTISISEIRFSTENEGKRSDEQQKYAESSKSLLGVTRTVSISGVNIAALDLRQPVWIPPSQSSSRDSTVSPASFSGPSFRASGSPASSSSSLDEDTQFLMSQSLAFLPPRPPSPTDSAASSLYQSAISAVSRIDDKEYDEPIPEVKARSKSKTPSLGHAKPDMCNDGGGTNETSKVVDLSGSESSSKQEIILSFGTEPILIQLTTPSPSQSLQPSLLDSSVANSDRQQHKVDHEKLLLSLTIGTLACALQAWQIRSILDLVDCWMSHQSHIMAPPGPPTQLDSETSVLGAGFEADVRIRGLVILFLSSSGGPGGSVISAASTGFFARPFIPPQLHFGYTRLSIENISASGTLGGNPSTPLPPNTHTGLKNQRTSNSNVVTATFTVRVTDLSLFAFSVKHTSQNDSKLLASPILITDPHLPSQYFPEHVRPDDSWQDQHSELPTFDVTDWTDEKYYSDNAKVSIWRSKLKRGPSHSEPTQQSDRTPVRIPPLPHAREGHQVPEVAVSAITISSRRVVMISASKRDKGRERTTETTEVNLMPLHIFIDLGHCLSSEGFVTFLDDVAGSGFNADVVEEGDVIEDEEQSDDDGYEDGVLPPVTPYVLNAEEQEIEREKERRRLEKLVMKDLDLEFDYLENNPNSPRNPPKRQTLRKRRATGDQSSISINIPMVRLQARCPPPPGSFRRSGSLILDLHNIILATGSIAVRPEARFTNIDAKSSSPVRNWNEDTLITAVCRRLVIASSPIGSGKAVALISLGPLSDANDLQTAGIQSSTSLSPLQPRIALTKSRPFRSASASSYSPVTALSVDIPSVHVDLTKSILDSLQYWADDATQLFDRNLGTTLRGSDTEHADSRNTSIIGSRYFTRSHRSDSGNNSRTSGSHRNTNSETVIKATVSEAFIRIRLPRNREGSNVVRPFIGIASDVDVLLELKPEGRDETVITLGVMNLRITDFSPSEAILLLSLTAPRSLMSSHKPLVKLRFTSLIIPETIAKESRVRLSLWGFTYNLSPELSWTSDLAQFIKAPPGAFESVIPSECTRLSINIVESSIRASAPTHPGAVVLHIGDLQFSTVIIGDSLDSSFSLAVPNLSLLVLDDLSGVDLEHGNTTANASGRTYWKEMGYALVVEMSHLGLKFDSSSLSTPPSIRVGIDQIELRIHLCADTLTAITAFATDLGSAFKTPDLEPSSKPFSGPTIISEEPSSKRSIMSSVDEHAFRRPPDVGSAPDMIVDDLPTNLDYLDESFGTAAGLRELRDDDLYDFDVKEAEIYESPPQQTGIISKVGGETIKMLHPKGIHIIADYFDTLQPDSLDDSSQFGATNVCVRLHNGDITLFLYDGYDWVKTRKTIQDEVKDMRRRLAKIRQLVASGQTQDPSIEETSTVLFNSVYIGLDEGADELEAGALIAAIDEELKDDVDTVSRSSWQSLKSPTGKSRAKSTHVHGKRLTRSKAPSIEFKFSGVEAEIDQYQPKEPLVSRTFATIRDLEILDHVKTSTWKKFLTEMRSDSRGNVRETDSDMVRVELRSLHPVPEHPSEESRLRAKILPLRLYVDQDALDFLKKFFSFKDPHAVAPNIDTKDSEIYFQSAEIFPVDLKLDYKPRRVDYRALREGKTIELMNFFHFDGAEMTLRHITLSGITGWPRLFDKLNDLWTPDVKATQLVDVISGVAPIRSVVNVGSGVADLVLLPIAQYKKDGRIVRGVQKGTTAFVKSTATEAIKLGARLATGTQVILEQAEGVLGGQFRVPITTETVHVPTMSDEVNREFDTSDDDEADLISKYAGQPVDIVEGVQSAYKSLHRNLNSAAQTILAVPMEVYERSGQEGPVRAVIRAVPIAVLKPMIGASEAVSKTLLGLHNSLDPNIRHENEAKYKQVQR